MSFTYGGTNTDSLAGVKAALQSWPSLGGLSLETVEAPRGGRFFGGAPRARTRFVHTVTIYNDSPDETRRDNLVGLLDPSKGPRDLILETDARWKFPEVVVSEEINWEPMVYDPELGFMWRAEVVMETVGPAQAVLIEPVVRTFSAPGKYTLEDGNTSTHPGVEFPSGPAATVKIGGFSVNIAETPSGLTNVLDYDAFDFYQRKSSGARVRSLVNYMSNYDRPELRLGAEASVSVTKSPSTAVKFDLLPNARRV